MLRHSAPHWNRSAGWPMVPFKTLDFSARSFLSRSELPRAPVRIQESGFEPPQPAGLTWLLAQAFRFEATTKQLY